MEDMIFTNKGDKTMSFKRKEWRCDTCDLKDVCNRFEAQSRDIPIIYCNKYVKEVEEREEDGDN